ncbi:phytanoyl-CoA dioxygenase, peroxisomal [Anabrus simplex]|uniref:phytanoyl-CoA dioxygenase, peroxisomal n=1 Tax=Anabrus simplex TaxID=316456 RepID=UPI0035A2B85D
MAAERRLKVISGHLQWRRQPRFCETSATSSEFRYTVDNPHLSWEQRKFYEENGYIVIPRLVHEELLNECCQRFLDICNGYAPKNQMTLMKDISLAKMGIKGERLYYKLQDIVWDDIFSKYILYPLILDYVECFTGPNVMAMHTMLINKPPDSGKMTSVHPLHQDLHYFPFRPADRIVASWTAMEKVTVDNGCLIVIPGSHKGELYPHEYPDLENGVNKGFHGVRGFDHVPKLSLEMEKGDTVFFHPLLIHGSGVNRTEGFRKAISCHYAASECEYIDVRGTTQENIAKEVEEMAKVKGFEIDFKDAWKYRCRIARGVQVNL